MAETNPSSIPKLADDLGKISDALLFGMGDWINGVNDEVRAKLHTPEVLYVRPDRHPLGMTVLGFLDISRNLHVSYYFGPAKDRQNPMKIINAVANERVEQEVDVRLIVETDRSTPVRLGLINFEPVYADQVQIDSSDPTLVIATGEWTDMLPFSGDHDDGIYRFIDNKARELARVDELLEMTGQFL